MPQANSLHSALSEQNSFQTDEEWRPVDGFPYLEVSSVGRVRRLERILEVAPRNEKGKSLGNFRKRIEGGVVKQQVLQNGYFAVDVVYSGKKHRFLAHRLVAFAFVPGHFECATVDHIDGDRLNNRASNLQWVSRQENTRLQNAAGRGVPKGERHPGAKLKDSDVPIIIRLRQEGMSLNAIGRQFGVSGPLIHKITTGKRRSA